MISPKQWIEKYKKPNFVSKIPLFLGTFVYIFSVNKMSYMSGPIKPGIATKLKMSKNVERCRVIGLFELYQKKKFKMALTTKNKSTVQKCSLYSHILFRVFLIFLISLNHLIYALGLVLVSDSVFVKNFF